MKLLVFAHKPPPHHGQSYMVQILLDVLAAQPSDSAVEKIQFYHVDARVSTGLEDVGRMRFGKIFLILKYCWQALLLRLRHGITHFYYVPANPSRAALYRDWIVMVLCRPFFKTRIFHWHAIGLPEWLENHGCGWERWITRTLLARPDLSIVLAEYNRRDAEKMESRKIITVPNGIPDPCPFFAKEVLPARQERGEVRKRIAASGKSDASNPSGAGHIFKVLYIGLCHEPKGLFDALEAVALVNTRSAGPFQIHLTVAGTFWLEEEKERFEKRLQNADLVKEGKPVVTYRGFVSGEEKKRLFIESDCLCFPTWYPAESFGLVLLEAMAYGLPIVATNWRMIPEVLPARYAGIVPPKEPAALARALENLSLADYDPSLRERFLRHFTAQTFGANMKFALLAATE